MKRISSDPPPLVIADHSIQHPSLLPAALFEALDHSEIIAKSLTELVYIIINTDARVGFDNKTETISLFFWGDLPMAF